MTKQEMHEWLPTLETRFRDLLVTDVGNQEEKEEVFKHGGVKIFEWKTKIYYEMPLSNALKCDLQWSKHEGGKYTYLAQRLLASNLGSDYCASDVLRVMHEVKRLEEESLKQPTVITREEKPKKTRKRKVTTT